ncbi:plasmid replication initiator protein [Mycolicibacterium litorale]|uniref:Plasmid replication initiator protein n=2 Tax=Candidatus Mycolicibacterium alkanivorans TaxID=2954114 RepID=A0ABS9YWJ2_9MYCO|nr:replication initiator [Candidatus Mycolicibacterium alkanivorans]MCI4675598.1 plasmid replication initiator protein [Candidatus Mycolicibacterium alkanivorans]
MNGSVSDIPSLPDAPAGVDSSAVLTQMVRRAASPSFDTWWDTAERCGFCASPIRLKASDEFGRQHHVLTRCNNRRATACPSCSDLYARDIWQMIHAGLNGGHHGIPSTVADHPQLFVTLTAPSFGAVHTTRRNGTYHPGNQQGTKCAHERIIRCNCTHSLHDPAVGQPLCSECYDYVGHVLFAWHAPELWRRFTIRLRRSLSQALRTRGADPKGTRPSFVKVVELQRRGVPHFHAVIRLDAASPPGEQPSPPEPNLDMADFVELVRRATVDTKLAIRNDVVLRFGEQLDIKSISGAGIVGSDADVHNRRVAGYLAKYVTKSVTDHGIDSRRLSEEGIDQLDVTDHVRRILQTIVSVARDEQYQEMTLWLHTLGFRGHVTSKSRQFSTTMKALREHRADWRRERAGSHPEAATVQQLMWEFERSGYENLGDRLLVISASTRAREQRLTGRNALKEGA